MDPYLADTIIYMREDVRILDYFSNPPGVRAQKSLEYTAIK